MNIYVGNLSFDVSEENLQKTFKAFGQVSSATIVRDKYTCLLYTSDAADE
mgnify:CR=1 FL=1